MPAVTTYPAPRGNPFVAPESPAAGGGGFWNFMDRNRQQASPGGQAGGSGAPGAFRGPGEALSWEAEQLRRRQPGREARAGRLQGYGDSLLLDPTRAANLFQGQYAQTAAALAAPQQRQFADTVRGVAGNTAARFGGNASTEENRQVNAASDLFSRNLAEQIAGLSAQSVGAGTQYAFGVNQAGEQAMSDQDRVTAMILQAVAGYPEKQKSNFGSQALGTAIGVGASLL